MKINIIILIVFVILSNVYYASAINEQDYSGDSTKDSYSNMEPSFSLATPNNKPIINRGDTMEFEVYISGYGHVANLTKIYASLPIGLVDEDTIYGSVHYLDFSSTGELTKSNFPLNTANAFYVYFPNNYFNQIKKTNSDNYSILVLTEMNYLISGEMVAPILIKITTSENAPDGDNKINLILTYSDGKKWYQDEQEISFHVNSFWEQYYIYHLIITGVVISILGNLYDMFARKNKKN